MKMPGSIEKKKRKKFQNHGRNNDQNKILNDVPHSKKMVSCQI